MHFFGEELFLFGTYESGAVVIPDSFGISKSFQDWVRLNDLVFQGGFALSGFTRRADTGEISNDFLGVFRLASSRLTPGREVN